MIGLGGKSAGASPLLSVSKIILGGATAAYGIKKGRDYINKGENNQKK